MLQRLMRHAEIATPRRPRQQKRPPPNHRRKPLNVKALRKRRARDSNPQPLSGHHISSVAASHSLTLRNSLRNLILRLALLPVKGLIALRAQRARKTGCSWIAAIGPECGRQRTGAIASLHSSHDALTGSAGPVYRCSEWKLTCPNGKSM